MIDPADESFEKNANGFVEGKLHFKFGADGASDQRLYKMGFGKPSSQDTVQNQVGRGEDEEMASDGESSDDEDDAEAGGGVEQSSSTQGRPSDASVWAATLVPLGLQIADKWVTQDANHIIKHHSFEMTAQDKICLSHTKPTWGPRLINLRVGVGVGVGIRNDNEKMQKKTNMMFIF